MVAQGPEGVWPSLLLTIVPVALVIAVFSTGRPKRGRAVPPRVLVIAGVAGALVAAVVLFLPYGQDAAALTRAAAIAIPMSLLIAALGFIRWRRGDAG
jgi:hypothetical protein